MGVKGLFKPACHRSRNKWRKLPACDPAICRKLEAYATQKSDSYFSNGAKGGTACAFYFSLGVVSAGKSPSANWMPANRYCRNSGLE